MCRVFSSGLLGFIEAILVKQYSREHGAIARPHKTE
jgi:hypothetical protein